MPPVHPMIDAHWWSSSQLLRHYHSHVSEHTDSNYKLCKASVTVRAAATDCIVSVGVFFAC